MWPLSSRSFWLIFGVLSCLSTEALAWTIEGLSPALKRPLLEVLDEDSDPESTCLQYLQSQGYYQSRVFLKGTAIHIHLGEPVRVGDIVLTEGTEGTLLSAKAYKDLIHHYPLKKGDIFSHEKHEDGKQALLFALHQQGYPRAFLSHSLVKIHDKSTADIHITLHRGPLVHFGDVIIESEVFRNGWLNRLSPIQPGEIYSSDKVEALQRELIQTDYFRHVDVEPSFDEQNAVMNIHVKTLPRHKNVQVGAGYGTDSGARGRMGVHWPHLWQEGHSARLKTLYAQRRQDHSLVYRWPGSHPTSNYYSALIGYNELKPQTHLFRTQKFQFAHTKIQEQWERVLSVAYEKEGFKTSKTTAYAITELLVPKIQLTTHQRHKFMLSLLGSIEGLCSPVSFMQVDIQARQQFSLNTMFQIRTKQQITGTLTNQFHEIPLSHRLYAGGTQSLRGYAYRSLGPVQGGRHRLLGSIELFASPWDSKARVFSFVDAGNAFNDRFTPKLSAGIGLGWQTPVGMLQLAVAKPVNDTRGWRFHLEISS